MSLLLNNLITYARAALTKLQVAAGARTVVGYNSTTGKAILPDGSSADLPAMAYGTGVTTFLATPSSANLKAALTDETGSGGALVFATSPTIAAPIFTGSITGQGATLQQGNVTLVAGATNGLTTIADSTLKAARFETPHYLAAEENLLWLTVTSNTAANILDFGGNSGTKNSATQTRFYAAADTITLTGTLALDITNTKVTIPLSTASTTPATGALVVTGGVGVGGALTGASTITGTALIPTGSSVPTNGMYLAGTNIVSVSCNSTQVLRCSTSQVLHIGVDTVLPKTSGKGIMVDTSTPTFPWKDLIGQIIPTGGGVAPSFNVFRGTIRAYQYTVNDESQITFHIPHDYVPGTDIYVHVHWAHASATVTSGSVTWSLVHTYAKGHNQAAFPAEKTVTVAQTASTTQYQHMLAEAVISTSTGGGTATLMDNAVIEPDGILMVRVFPSANTVNGTPEPYIFTVDVHYQSTGIGTKQKAPAFYT